MLKDPEFWMRRALALGEKAAQAGEVPVGAVLVAEDKIIGEGFNSRLSSSRTIAHAEVMALEDYNARSGLWRAFPGTSLVVTVEPCLMCTGALLWARIDSIYYGCPDNKNAGLVRVKPLIGEGVYDHRFKLVQDGVLKEEAQDLISSFFSQVRLEKKQKAVEIRKREPDELSLQ